MTDRTSIKDRIAEIPRDCPHHEVFSNCENPFYLMDDTDYRHWALNLAAALGIKLSEFWDLMPKRDGEDRPKIPSVIELEYALAKFLELD